jgi:quercetin dioxygenase-like cupin family protein
MTKIVREKNIHAKTKNNSGGARDCRSTGGDCRRAQSNLAALFTLTPGEMMFVSEPARPDLASSVLVGDPSRAGIYAVHTRLPANLKIEPHSHSEAWRIATVLSGTLYYGYGDTFDETKLKALGPGSLLVEPRDAPHFAMTKDEEVMLHIVGEGPAGTNLVRK